MGISKVLQNFHSGPNLQKLYLSESTADSHFVFDGVEAEPAERIPVHKCLLAIASPVFHQMFFGGLKENGDVKIIDASQNAFKEFLQFFYLDKITLTTENIAEVMMLADKYAVAGCMHICTQFLEVILSVDTAVSCYELSKQFDLKYLLELSVDKICRETKNVLTSESFLLCQRSTLKRIISLDELSCDEIFIFDACMRWAAEACNRANVDSELMSNRKEQLGECFDLIRFPAMSTEEFSKCTERDGLFSGDEVIDILRHLTLHQELRVATRFPRGARRGTPAWTKDETITICDRRSQLHLSRTAKIKRDVIVLSSNERILIGQISISTFKPNGSDEKSTRDGMMQIFKRTVDKGGNTHTDTLLTQTVEISSSGYTKIPLLTPVVVQPFIDYVIETEWQLQDEDELVLRTDCREEIMLDGGIRFQFKREPDVGYDNQHEGLVSKIYFKKW